MTAREQKSPCTDGEVAEMVARLRRYTRSKMGAISEILENDARQAADLLTSLSAERDRLAEEKDAITKFTNGQIARADNAEAERDALKARVAEVLEPFRARHDDAVRTDDSDTSGLTVKVRDLRAASELHATLSGERK